MSAKYSSPRNYKTLILVLSCIAGVLAAILLGILLFRSSFDTKNAPAQLSTEPETHTQTQAEAQAPAPEYVVSPDSDPKSLTCKASYSADGANASGDTVVATAGNDKLTLGMLEIYYQMELAAFRQENSEAAPDFDQPLDCQLCPIADGNISWQHYFLQRALRAWQVQQALNYGSMQPQFVSDPFYEPNQERHDEYLNADYPALRVLYGNKDQFIPNSQHQAYLDGLPALLEELAAKNGFADIADMEKTLTGGLATDRDFADYAAFLNRAYMYLTELSYELGPTEEEIAAAAGSDGSGHDYVDIVHILVQPENATFDADGKVSAEEADWTKCRQTAEKLATSILRDFRRSANEPAAYADAAYRNSADTGSSINGGKYLNLQKGQLIPELDDWCFDADRQSGDAEILESPYGLHLVYWTAGRSRAWAEARQDLIAKAYTDKLAEYTGKNPMQVDYSAITLIDTPSAIAMDEILYPDIAHQKYPEMPLYLQQDFPNAKYGASNVARGGCGITTLAMLTSYLADDTLTPARLAADYSVYRNKMGTDGTMFRNVPQEFGYYWDDNVWDWPSVEEALKQGKIVISLQHPGYFTSYGHFMALTQLTEDGKVVIRDSNIFNYPKLPEHLTDAFDPHLITAANQVFWVYAPKITRIPACSRCGNPEETSGAPLAGNYVCEKCSAALTRHSMFLALQD